MTLAEAAHLERRFDLIISIPEGHLRSSFSKYGTIVAGTPSMPVWGDSARRWLGRSVRTVVHAVRLARLIRAAQVDVVLTSSSVSVAPVIAARLARVPAIVHARDVPGSRLAPLVFTLQGFLATTVIVIHDSLRPYFSRARSTRVVEIPDGVRLPRSSERDPGASERRLRDPIRLCVIGGIHPRKGQDTAIEALAYLRDAGVQAHLDVVGREIDPAFAAYLRQLTSRLNVEDQVSFRGELHDVSRHLSGVDVVVAPSRGEWTPLAIMEALAHGKPVVAAAVGGVSSIIHTGVTGWLVDPDDPQGLATAIRRVQADPSNAARMAALGREAVEARFSIAATLTGLDREIRLLLPTE